jgi:hypothetical protein
VIKNTCARPKNKQVGAHATDNKTKKRRKKGWIPMKVWSVIAGLTVALVAVVALVAPSVLAQGPNGTRMSNGFAPQGMGGMGGMNGPGLFHHGPWTGEDSPLTIVAEQLGMTTEELKEEIFNGKSVEELAEEREVDLTTIVDELLSKRTERLDTYVDKGYISQQDAETARSMTRVHTFDLLTRSIPTTITNAIKEHRFGTNNPLSVVAESLDMHIEDIISEVRTGSTIAEVIADNGGDVDAIADEVVAQQAERLQQAVDNGRITQEQADSRLETMRDNLIERWNQTWTEQQDNAGRGFRPHRGGHSGPMMP